MNCVVPTNLPIYNALLAKAASYPADKPYQAKAYKNAAAGIAATKIDIYSVVKNHINSWEIKWDLESILYLGPSTMSFIIDYAKNNPLPPPTGSFVSGPLPQRQIALGGPITPSCIVPANQPIYQALLEKAATYPPDKVYQANAYRKAAEKILNSNINIYDVQKDSRFTWEFEQQFALRDFHLGTSTRLFIFNYIKKNPETVVPAPAPKITIKPSANGCVIECQTKADIIQFVKTLVTSAGITASEIF